MVQITRLRTVAAGSAQDLERVRAEFARQHCVMLPRILEPDLLSAILHGLDRSEFYERTHEGIGVELCLQPASTSAMLGFLSNSQTLFQVIREITGCGTIGCFDGRVYRMIPGTGHYDSWHSDASRGRMIAMSINLSAEPYRGGVLQIRDARSKRILHEVANVGPGDAIIFRIAPDLHHRVTAVEGSVPKTAYAGWFQSEPDYSSLLRRALQPRHGVGAA